MKDIDDVMFILMLFVLLLFSFCGDVIFCFTEVAAPAEKQVEVEK